MRIEVEIKPFNVPQHVVLIVPGEVTNRTDGARTMPISELNSHQLEELCSTFRTDVFNKAKLRMPPTPERPTP